MENGERKRSGFSRAGLRNAHDVSPAHERRDRFGLNGRWFAISFAIKRF